MVVEMLRNGLVSTNSTPPAPAWSRKGYSKFPRRPLYPPSSGGGGLEKILLPPWPPLVPGEIGPHPLGADTIPHPPSQLQGDLAVPYPPPPSHSFSFWGWWSPPSPRPIVPAAAAAAWRCLFRPSSLCLYRCGGDGHPPGPIIISPVSPGVACPCPSHPPRLL